MRRIARELHDVIGHSLAAVNVQARVAATVFDTAPEQARDALAAIETTSRDALREARAALSVLRRGDQLDPTNPVDPGTPAPGLDQLDALLGGVRAAGLQVSVHHDHDSDPLPALADAAAYRIVQESLTNVLRHAHATQVSIHIGQQDGVLGVEVLDDGRGPVTPGPDGSGLVGMRERAAALGGHLQAGPAPGGGFRVAARIPVTTGTLSTEPGTATDTAKNAGAGTT